MEIYEYKIDEWSEDTRKFIIKSDRKLTHDEVCDIYQDASFDDEGKTIEYTKGITLLYRGTNYGSSDHNITGDELVDDE